MTEEPWPYDFDDEDDASGMVSAVLAGLVAIVMEIPRLFAQGVRRLMGLR